MALLPQSPRDQRLLVVAILALGLAGVYEQLVWTPKNTTLNTLQVKLDTLDSLNHLTKLEVAKGNTAQMKREAAAYTKELEVLQGLVPTANEVSGLLESVSSAARRAGLEISDVAPDGVVNGDQYDTYRYKLGVTGPYHQIAEFLANVATLPRIVEPINLTLTPSSRSGEIKAKREEQMLDARFQVQTYVSHATIKNGTTSAKPGAPL
ncbi:MAG TPA: type 4a pilus biogenesis protein PilO [Gemmatimonadaceae bacterium]|nr:type 4a pilus biogenesis protein PilO [Gemmatimonadaceae bacterium]